MQKHISHWGMSLLLFVSSCHLNLEVVFFSRFLNYFICQQTFGILRKANITSNDFIIMIIIIIIIKNFLTYPIKMKEREASLFNSFFSFHLICNKMFHKLDYYYYFYYYLSENRLLIIHQASYAFAKIKS